MMIMTLEISGRVNERFGGNMSEVAVKEKRGVMKEDVT